MDIFFILLCKDNGKYGGWKLTYNFFVPVLRVTGKNIKSLFQIGFNVFVVCLKENCCRRCTGHIYFYQLDMVGLSKLVSQSELRTDKRRDGTVLSVNIDVSKCLEKVKRVVKLKMRSTSHRGVQYFHEVVTRFIIVSNVMKWVTTSWTHSSGVQSVYFRRQNAIYLYIIISPLWPQYRRATLNEKPSY